jgi:hypothetical protein
MKCQAITKKGKQCNGGAMPFNKFCGPHSDQPTKVEQPSKETKL